MAYRSRLVRQQAPTVIGSAPSTLSWEPPTTSSLFSSFPGASSTASPLATSPTVKRADSYAGLQDLPDELLLVISDLLYLPPTEYSSAHARNPDLCALGLAGNPRVQRLVRSVLFEQTTCTTDREVKWLLRRAPFMSFVRSVASRPKAGWIVYSS